MSQPQSSGPSTADSLIVASDHDVALQPAPPAYTEQEHNSALNGNDAGDATGLVHQLESASIGDASTSNYTAQHAGHSDMGAPPEDRAGPSSSSHPESSSSHRNSAYTDRHDRQSRHGRPESHAERHGGRKDRPNLLERLDPRGRFSQKSRPDVEDVYIAIMGVTGAGKSTFVQMCSGINVKIGETLESCTMQVEDFTFMFNDRIRVHLIDTPGFDDTHRSDTDVLRDIASWLGIKYQEGVLLQGIIYLHRIMDPRMTGGATRNLAMFKKLCGPECFESLMLATTFWNGVGEEKGRQREQELLGKKEFWADMVAQGAKYMRHTNDRHSAMNILQIMVSHRRQFKTRIQSEMVDDHLDLDQTGAGRKLNKDLNEMRERHKREMADLEEALKAAAESRNKEAKRELEELKRNLQREIKEGKDAQQDLVANLEKISSEREEDLRRYQEGVEQRIAEMEDLKREIDKYKDGSHESQLEQEAYLHKMEELQGELEALRRKQPTRLQRVVNWIDTKLDRVEDFIKNM